MESGWAASPCASTTHQDPALEGWRPQFHLKIPLWHLTSPLMFLTSLYTSLIGKQEWESQFLGRLIRSPGVPKERGVWNSQGGRKDKHLFFFFFSLHSLVLVNYTTQFKLCTRDYITTLYPGWGQFLLPENLLTNSDILECILWERAW